MPSDQEMFLPNIDNGEIITNYDPHIITASKLLSKINAPQNEIMIFIKLMQAVWNDELPIYTIKIPQDNEKNEYNIDDGVLIRTALDPNTFLPVADKKGREIPGEIEEEWQRIEWSREKLLRALHILGQSQFGGVGPEYKPEPKTWAVLARRSPSLYDPHMVYLGQLRTSPEHLVEWCRRNGLVPWAAWLRLTPITGDPTSRPPVKLRPTWAPPISEAKLKEWLLEWVRKHPGDVSLPGRDASHRAARADFPDHRVPRTMFWTAWMENTPAEWHRSGPKKLKSVRTS